ncbi:MAG: VIT1/CCC1 family protein [Bacteroidales bacterium]
MREIPKQELLAFQRHELNGAIIYRNLAKITKNKANKNILSQLAEKEWEHYETMKEITGRDLHPVRIKIIFFYLLARIFGLVFGIKLMEYNTKREQKLYKSLSNHPDYQHLIEEGEEKETLLINDIDEERLYYMGAIVLGLNDALIEFTGALAGFAFAFQHHQIVAMAGGITGIAAALSMGASEYMAAKADKTNKSAVKAAIYTCSTYLITVILLLLPFILLQNVYWGIGICLFIASLIIGTFNFYYAVTRNENFWKRFLEMLSISFSVAFVSFAIGWLMKHFTGINI